MGTNVQINLLKREKSRENSEEGTISLISLIDPIRLISNSKKMQKAIITLILFRTFVVEFISLNKGNRLC